MIHIKAGLYFLTLNILKNSAEHAGSIRRDIKLFQHKNSISNEVDQGETFTNCTCTS